MVAFLVVLLILLLGSGPVALVLVLRLRDEVRRGQRAFPVPPGSQPAAPPTPPAPPTATPIAPPPRPARRRDLEATLGGAWLTWLGVMALFFGTAFFLAYDLRGSS